MADLKSGPTLREWLERVVGATVPAKTRGVAHGGTSLTFRGIKDTTKDVDLAFLEKTSFEACRKALLAGHYNLEADFQVTPGETFHRYRNEKEAVDLVDLRFPTWNSWVMKGAALNGCERFAHRNFELLVPDVETTFVFKTYPCRASDINDLQRILEKVPTLDWSKIRRIVEEQETFAKEKEHFSTELLIGESRGRAYASTGVLLASGEKRVAAFHGWVKERWEALRLPAAAPQELLEKIRTDHAGERFPWRDELHRHENQIAKRLGLAG